MSHIAFQLLNVSCPSQAHVFELLASYSAVYILCRSRGAFGRWVLARRGSHGLGGTLNTRTWQVDLFLLQPHRDMKNWTNSSCKRLTPWAAILMPSESGHHSLSDLSWHLHSLLSSFLSESHQDHKKSTYVLVDNHNVYNGWPRGHSKIFLQWMH